MCQQKLLAWLWLGLAIITEVLGSSFLKIAQNLPFGFLVTAAFICISYYFIGLAIKRISVSVAYAMWEVLGVMCIVIIGLVVFDEQLSSMQYAGIACAIGGIILINFGEQESTSPESKGVDSHTPESSARESAAVDSSSIDSHIIDSPAPSLKSIALLGAGLLGVVALSLLGLWWHSSMLGFVFVCIAAVLDVVANLLLKASAGFSRIGLGLGAVGVVIGAFYLLMLALDSMELAVAYSSWGAIGIIGTIAGGRILFGERLNVLGYVGVGVVICAVGLLHKL